MKLDSKKIKLLTIDELYIQLSPTIKKVYSEYEYLYLDEVELKNIVYECLSKLKYNYTDDNSIDKFTKDLNKKFISILKEKFKNKNECLKILDNYINLNINLDNKNGNTYYLYQINKFLTSNDLIVEPDTIIELLDKNKIFNTILNKFVHKNIEIIKKDKLNSIVNGDNIILFIETYCMLNDIIIGETIEENEKDDFFADDIIVKSTVKSFISEIIKYPLLTKEEEKELAIRISNNDEMAKQQFIDCNLRLVVNIAKRYVGRGFDLEDLIQEGTFGLIKAVEMFDIKKGFRFSTYATQWIRQSITRSIHNNGRSIRIPVHLNEKIPELKDTIELLEMKLNRTPTIKEIAGEMNLSEKSVKTLISYQDDTLSIDKVIGGDDEELTLESLLASNDKPDEEVINDTLKDDLTTLINICNFNEREIDVLFLRFGLIDGREWTLEEIGKKHNLTRERIRQIEAKVLRKLRNSKYIKGFANYLDFPEKAMKQIDIYRKAYRLEGNKHKNFLSDYNGSNILSNVEVDFHVTTSIPALPRKTNKKEKKEPKLQKISTSKEKKMEKIYKTIYEDFSAYTKDEIIEVLSVLSKEEMDLIKLRYGNNLNIRMTNIIWIKDDETKFNEVLVPKIKKMLTYNKKQKTKKEKTKKTIFEYFSNYPNELVSYALKRLTPEDLNALRQKFGYDLMHPISKTLYGNKTTKKISYLLTRRIPNLINSDLNNEKTRRIEHKTIYEYLSDYDKNTIDEVLNKLPEKDKDTLKLRFGEDYISPVSIKTLTKEKQKRISNIINQKIKKLLNEPKKELEGNRAKTIYDYFKEYNKEEIDLAIGKLSEDDISLLKLKFGEDYMNYNMDFPKELYSKFYSGVVQRIKNILTNPDYKLKKGKTENIYEFFEAYTFNEVNEMLKLLSEDELKLLRLKFGYDFAHPITKPVLNDEQATKLNYLLYVKIKRLLNNLNKGNVAYKKAKTLYEYLKDYTDEEIKKALENLKDEERYLLKLKYGEDYKTETNNILTKKQEKKINDIKLRKLKKVLENPELTLKSRKVDKIERVDLTKPNENIIKETTNDTTINLNLSKDNYIEILKMLKTPTFKELMSLLTPKQAIIIALRLGYVDEKYFTTESIAKFLGIEEKEVRETTKHVLLTYKDNINTLIDKAIEITGSKKVLINKEQVKGETL